MRGPRSFIDRMRHRAAVRQAQRAAADLPPDVSMTLVLGGHQTPIKGSLDVDAIARALGADGLGGAP